MKTISIRLEDTIYEELRSIPFIVPAPTKARYRRDSDKLAAFARLEESRKSFSEFIDYDEEKAEAMNVKYGVVD